jgi:hypothetical protein
VTGLLSVFGTKPYPRGCRWTQISHWKRPKLLFTSVKLSIQQAVLGKTAPTSAKLETSVDFVHKGKAKNSNLQHCTRLSHLPHSHHSTINALDAGEVHTQGSSAQPRMLRATNVSERGISATNVAARLLQMLPIPNQLSRPRRWKMKTSLTFPI